MMDYKQSGSHIANGNRMRLTEDATIRLDERWKSELSGEMLDYFNRNGSSLNQYLGYGS